MGNYMGVHQVCALVMAFFTYIGERDCGSTMRCGGYIGFGPRSLWNEEPAITDGHKAVMVQNYIARPAIVDGHNAAMVHSKLVQESIPMSWLSSIGLKSGTVTKLPVRAVQSVQRPALDIDIHAGTLVLYEPLVLHRDTFGVRTLTYIYMREVRSYYCLWMGPPKFSRALAHFPAFPEVIVAVGRLDVRYTPTIWVWNIIFLDVRGDADLLSVGGVITDDHRTVAAKGDVPRQDAKNTQVYLVQPGANDAGNSFAWGRGLHDVTVGELAFFHVQTGDTRYNDHRTEQEKTSISVIVLAHSILPPKATPIMAFVNSTENGHFTVSYTTTGANTVEVAVVTNPLVVERQEVTFTLMSATAGSGYFTLGLGNQDRTAPISVYAAPATVAYALSAVRGIGTVNVSRSVTNAGLCGAEIRWVYVVDFISIVGDVEQLSINKDTMAGLSCAPVITTVKQGHANHIRGSPFRPVVSTAPASSKVTTPRDAIRVWNMAKKWIGTLPLMTLIFHLLGFLYVASKPLRYGNGQVAQHETMPYWKRLLAVFTLYLLCGGAPMIFFWTEGYLMYWVWKACHTWWGLVPVVGIAILTFVTMRPLPYRRPVQRVLMHPIFALWREYFDYDYIVQDRDMLARLVADDDNTFFLAQLPHGIMPFGAILGNSLGEEVFPGMSPMSGVVATLLLWTPVLRHLMNWLGVREAGTESINTMFDDGFKTVGVVTGGIAEMFVSNEVEKITRMRSGFARIALTGGHVVLPIFVFGASRTHVIAPGCSMLKGLSRKYRAPLMIFHGAFSVVPYRQQMKMVVGRPVILRRVAEPTTNDIQEAIEAIHGCIVNIYNDPQLKPAWETRPLQFST